MSLTVGILGGMGPLATADFYRCLIEATPAATDQEHLHVIIDADPRVPDRSAALRGHGEDPTPWLVRGAQRLATVGATIIAVPCNTAHAFLPAVRTQVPVPILDMVAETASAMARCYPATAQAGLLATRGTIESRLYHDAFARHGVQVLVPDNESQSLEVDAAIALVKGGDDLPRAAQLLRDAAGKLRQEGAELLVAGCTEIPVVLRAATLDLPLIDATQVLVQAVLREVGAVAEPVAV